MEKGNYSISYKVRDFFGNYADTDTRVIYNVKDTVAPTVKVVEPYTVEGVDTTTDDFKDARKDASYLIPSIAGLNGIYSLNTASTDGVVFPAIYAEDNYSKLGNLTLQRSVIRKTNGNTEIIDGGKNYYENVTWKFTYADTYTVQYKATDEAGNTRIATYEIKIVDTGVDSLFGANGDEPNGDKTAPTISFTGVLPTSTKAGDTISFTKPTAIDYIKDSTSISDTRLNVVTYYFAGNTIPMNAGKVDYSKLTVVNEDEDNTNNLSFVVPKTITDSYVSVYTEVSDDYGNLASVTKSIKLLSITDTIAPVTTSGTSIESELKQGGTITLPDIVVSDANASALVVNVEIKDKNNNSISWQGLNTTYASDKITLSGINFVAIQSGDYTISVVAKDLGNNYSVYGYKFTVAKTTKPNIELGQYSVTAELGDEINISDFKVMDEGTEVDKTDASLTYNVAISGGRYSPISNDTFIPLEAGTYTITYTASVSGISAESKAYTVTVKDTKSPVITIVGSEPTLQYDLDTESPKPITIPHFEATDAKGTAYDSLMDNTVTTKVTVVSNVSGASSDPLALTETTDGYQFTPSTKSGKYTVTYSATDAAGNTATKTFTLSVGDVVAPVINLNKNASDETSNEPGDKKINETLTLDLNNIAIDDNDDGPISALKADGKLIIKLVGPDNKSVENTSSDGYSYKLTQAGTYTLTYKVTDEAGNTATATRTFTVTADTIAQGIDSETGKVIGIVLSLAVLAGVIVYFLVSSKKDKKNAPKEKKEDKKASK
jgi:rRNA maturation endonuclease Nob1